MAYFSYKHKRIVPARVKLGIIFGKFQTIFGLVFFLFSLIFFAIFFSFVKFDEPGNNSPAIEGIVTKVERTNTSVNDREVYAFHFEYRLPDGTIHSGKSYSEKMYYETGSAVEIQYSADDPAISRIKGMRSGEFGPWIMLAMLPFLLTGLGFLIFGLKKAKKEIYLLQVGELAHGTLLNKEPTSVKINNQTVYKLTFQFTAGDGNAYTTVCKSHKPHLLEDEEKEKLVYDPNAPEQALLLDSLSQKLKRFFEEVE